VPVPSFSQIEQFCKSDGWNPLAPTDHQPYVKIISCPGQQPRTLHTQVSHNRGHSPSPDIWRFMLRTQLEVTEAQFWDVVRGGQPATRQCPPAIPAKTRIPATILYQLREYHVSEDEMRVMTKQDALDRLQQERMKPR